MVTTVLVRSESSFKKVKVLVKSGGGGEEMKVMLGNSRGSRKRDVHLHQG